MKIRNLEQSCSACPSAWTGKTVGGDDIYIRYRWGWLTVDINSSEIFGTKLGGEYDGVISWEDIAGIIDAIPA